MSTKKDTLFEAEDIAQLIHAKDPKNNAFIGVIHGYKAGEDVSFVASADLTGILTRIDDLFAEEFDYHHEVELFIRSEKEVDKSFEVHLKTEGKEIRRIAQVFCLTTNEVVHVDRDVRPYLEASFKRLLETAVDGE